MIRLRNDDIRLEVDPERGGGVTHFSWRGRDIFRTATAGSPLDLASFVLVPFSNRIAGGRFSADGREVRITPNMPGGGHPHPLHGFGWHAIWSVAALQADEVRLTHDYDGAEWPAPYRAEQRVRLLPNGFEHGLTVQNVGKVPMPSGLGFHPYLPRVGARLEACFAGRWSTDADGIPTHWSPLAEEPDWFAGAPIDTVFSGRHGPIHIDWPTHRLTIDPDDALAETVIYVPANADFFCVEPVTHITDAVNRAPDTMRWLAPGERWSVATRFLITARR